MYMTRTKKTLKGLMAMLVALAMTVALGVSMLASAADTATETVVVTQVIEKGTEPIQSTYTYWLTPEDATYPLPNELKNTTPTSEGKYKVGSITGNSTDKTALTMTFELDKTEPGTYIYYLEKTPKTPTGDTFSPEKELWKFGFRIKEDKTGKLVALTPEICVGGASNLSDIGEDGYPTKVTFINSIKGKPTTTKSPTNKPTTTPNGNSTNAPTSYRGGTNYTTNTRARWVNTGDPNSLILWVAILGVAALGLIIMVIVRRRKEDDDEQNF